MQLFICWYIWTVCWIIRPGNLTCHSFHVIFFYSINRYHKTGDLLTHWGRVTHICVDKLTKIGSDNGLSPGRRQAIILTNAGILLIRSLGTNFSEISTGIQTYFHSRKCIWKCRPFCLGLNVLRLCVLFPVAHLESHVINKSIVDRGTSIII